MAMRNTKQKSFWRIYQRSKFVKSDYRDDKVAILEEYNKIGLRDAEIHGRMVLTTYAKQKVGTHVTLWIWLHGNIFTS